MSSFTTKDTPRTPLPALFGGQSLPLIRQTEAAECGLACLAMVAGFHGGRTDLGTLRRRFALSLKGANLKTLISIAERMDFSPRALKAPMEALDQLSLPAVLHWDLNHFVVLKSLSRKEFVIHDPARGLRRLSPEEFSNHYTGIALELTPAKSFQKQNRVERLHLSQLWSKLTGLKRTMIQLIILSIVLQLFVLASPFYMQLVIDEVLVKQDTALLIVLAVGFGLFTLINVAAEALRGHVLLHAGSMMSFQMVTNLFRHLIRLPQSYFDKRHMGDIVSRFGSTRPIKDMLTEGVVASLIDGVMAILTLVLMFIYAVELALIVLAALSLFILLRIGFYRTFRRRSEDAILARAEENTNFMETVRGMLSIKLYGREEDRQQLWSNRYADAVNADVKVGRAQIWFKLFNTLLFGLENVLVIYVAAKLVLAGGFSIGMVFAFMAYKQRFVDAASQLVERAIEFRMLDLHLERLADIALSDPEPREDRLAAPQPLDGRIELEDVRFTYAEGEPDVIRGLTLRIEPGQSVAITGASGCGKTTLVKILLGLLEPSAGEIRVDGQPLKRYGVHSFRAQIGAVMQDDQLFAGSIADNIAFYDPEPDQQRILACAQAAAIHDEIMAMPMQYETLIGDMGTVLSGGQKQRVLLARALYRQPRMLVLDEGTAHLDTGTEARVNAAVKAMGITRILVAHRPETILSADRVVVMHGGRIVEDKPAAELLKGYPRAAGHEVQTA